MNRSPRLAVLALTASAGLALAACTGTVDAQVAASTQTLGGTSDPAPAHHHSSGPGSSATDGAASHSTGTGTGTGTHTGTEDADASDEDTSVDPSTAGTDTGNDGDLPVPGDGVPGDQGLCEAVTGWYGYLTLALLGAGANGDHVYPDDVVPLLDAMAQAPYDHLDADGALWDEADDLSMQIDDVIDEVTAGADAADAVSELDQPMSAFGDSCIRAGVSV